MLPRVRFPEDKSVEETVEVVVVVVLEDPCKAASCAWRDAICAAKSDIVDACATGIKALNPESDATVAKEMTTVETLLINCLFIIFF